MYKALLVVIFSFSIYAGEIDLGTLGAKGKFKRFGSQKSSNSKKARKYLVTIGQRRNVLLSHEIAQGEAIIHKVMKAEKDILEAIYER